MNYYHFSSRHMLTAYEKPLQVYQPAYEAETSD